MDFNKVKNFIIKYSPWWFLIITFLLFVNTASYEFLKCDDGKYVFNNPNFGYSWKILKPVLDLWTPLPQLSFLIDYTIGGFRASVYHIHNIIWHLGTVSMVWILLRQLGISPLAASMMSFLYAIHPQRVESVVWIAERKDVMLGFFYFSSLAVFIRARKDGRTGNVWSWLLMVGALLSKPFAISLPPVMFLLEVYRNRKWDFKLLFHLWPYFLTVLFYKILTLKISNPSASFQAYTLNNPFSAIMLILHNYLTFAAKTFLPLSLSPVYPYYIETFQSNAMVILAWIVLAMILVTLYWKKRNFLLYDLLPLILIFLGILLPVSGIIPFSNADFADRYSYLPAVFLLILAFNILVELKGKIKPEMKGILLGIYTAYLFLFTLFYCPVWQNTETYMLAATDYPQANYRIVFFLAFLQIVEDKPDEALALLPKAACGTLCHKVHSIDIQEYSNFIRGMAAYKKKEYSVAFPILLKFSTTHQSLKMTEDIRLDTILHLCKAMADMCLASGKTDKAVLWYEKINEHYATLEPFTAHFYNGVAAMISQDYARAVNCFEETSNLSPGNENCIRNLENAKAKLKEQKKSSE